MFVSMDLREEGGKGKEFQRRGVEVPLYNHV